MNEIEARIAGYTANLRSSDGIQSDLDIQKAYANWVEGQYLPPTTKLWEAFELGWHNAISQENYLTITEAAERAGVSRQYIKDEVRHNRLPANMDKGRYKIAERDFEVWMNNPRRGSRGKG